MTAKADKQTTITGTPVEPLCGATGSGAKCVSSVSATKFLGVVNKGNRALAWIIQRRLQHAPAQIQLTSWAWTLNDRFTPHGAPILRGGVLPVCFLHRTPDQWFKRASACTHAVMSICNSERETAVPTARARKKTAISDGSCKQPNLLRISGGETDAGSLGDQLCVVGNAYLCGSKVDAVDRIRVLIQITCCCPSIPKLETNDTAK